MNCGQRGEMRHRLRAYLPVQGGHGRVSQAGGFRTNHCAERDPHAQTGPAATLGSFAYFPLPVPLPPCDAACALHGRYRDSRSERAAGGHKQARQARRHGLRLTRAGQRGAIGSLSTEN
jgi:hypothetical protein